MMARIVGALLVTVAAAALGGLSQFPLTMTPDTEAVLRLAWRVNGHRVKACRKLTPEELEKIPAHMRRLEECSEHVVPYRLRVKVDGTVRADELVHAAGARRDRPISIFWETPVLPGARRVEVRFDRAEVPGTEQHDEPDRDHAEAERHGVEGPGPSAETRGETPATLDLNLEVMVAEREVILVTYDAEARRLVLERGTAP